MFTFDSQAAKMRRTTRRRASAASASACSSSSRSRRSLYYVVGICMLWSSSCCTNALVKLPENETIPAVIVFGDSIVDTGNNNYLKTLVKADFPPYGKDFDGGVATGRFSNGIIAGDLVASELGIKELVPPYLKQPLSPQDLLTGVCFASSASGYDPMTATIASVLSLSDQLEYFKDYVAKLKMLVGEDKTNFLLAESLFLVVAGSDDIANTYFTFQTRRLQYDISAYTDLMANSASDFLNEIYGLGARKVAVFGVPPIGCVPAQRTLGGGKTRECAEKSNQAAQLFNAKLSAKLDSIRNRWPETRMLYVDVYNPLLDLIQNPSRYGFEVVDKGCCGTGNIEVAVLCNPLTSTTCPNDSSYLFWDSYHPTEAGYKALVVPLAQKYAAQFF